jgi:hypothetical protein
MVMTAYRPHIYVSTLYYYHVSPAYNLFIDSVTFEHMILNVQPHSYTRILIITPPSIRSHISSTLQAVRLANEAFDPTSVLKLNGPKS